MSTDNSIVATVFKVTSAATRPAQTEKDKCFYCHSLIGQNHKETCVLINKKVKVKAVIEYEIEVPASWDKSNIEFHRNEGSWCSDNMIDELVDIAEGEAECLCYSTQFTYLHDSSEPFLSEA